MRTSFSPCGNEVSKFRLSSFRQLLELIDPFKHFFMAEAALELPKQQFAQARFCVASISMPKSPGLPVPVGLNRRWHKRKATCCCVKFRSMQRAVCAPHCQCSSLACLHNRPIAKEIFSSKLNPGAAKRIQSKCLKSCNAA